MGAHPHGASRRDFITAGSVGIWTLVLPAAAAAVSGDGFVSGLSAPSISVEPAGFASGSSESPRGAVEVAWGSVATATLYTVRYRDASADPAPAFAEVTTSGTRLVISGLDEGLTYEVEVVASDGTTWSAPSSPVTAGAVIAPGGSLIDVAGTEHVVHTFTGGGSVTLARTNIGLDVEYLCVGGGGGGGGAIAARRTAGGGGGGGGVATGTLAGVTGTVTVTVGGGGAGAVGIADDRTGARTSDGTSGAASTLSVGDTTVTAGGGAGGGRGTYTTDGLGGGGGWSGAPTGSSGGVRASNHGSGGGGADVAGGDASSTVPGSGGGGSSSSIGGASGSFGGGGGGGRWGSESAAAGGQGGGGAGATDTAAAAAGGTSTGGGGGGGSPSSTAARRDGGDGGSGIVVLRYALPVT